eukprot:14797633-Ditylum_brightwellii.AAC.1
MDDTKTEGGKKDAEEKEKLTKKKEMDEIVLDLVSMFDTEENKEEEDEEEDDKEEEEEDK